VFRKLVLGLSAAALSASLAVGVAVAGGGSLSLGPVKRAAQLTYRGYYDGHKDTFLVTDTSSKAQATAMHINYSAPLAKVRNAPRQFFIQGRAAPGQLSVFGSEPGESDYNPLWEEIEVRWHASATPVLLVRDDQIDGLAKAGKLSETDLHVVLNAPITKVGK